MQGENTLHFPDLGEVTIDQERAETFGLMTVSQDGVRAESRGQDIWPEFGSQLLPRFDEVFS